MCLCPLLSQVDNLNQNLLLQQGPIRALGTVSPDVEKPKLIYISSPALSHDRLGHPECAARGTAILDALQANKLTPEALAGQVCQAPSTLLISLSCHM